LAWAEFAVEQRAEFVIMKSSLPFVPVLARALAEVIMVAGLAGFVAGTAFAQATAVRQVPAKRPADAQGSHEESDSANGGESLAAWRAATINRLRAIDLGSFEYHAFRASDRQIRLADLLAGRIPEADYAAQENGPDFIDLYGLRMAGEEGAAIDWLATSDDGFIREKSQYGSFIFSIPLAAAFWKTGDAAYMRKWFSIAGSFARDQRRAVEAVPPDKRRMDNAPWVVGALPCLHQGNRVLAMIQCLAAFAKSLPSATDGSKPDWDRILRPVDSPAAPDAIALVPAEDLAAIVRSLGVEHPALLLTFYENPGALPNQRLEGLVALLTSAAVFPDIEGMDTVAQKAGEAMEEYLQTGFHKDGGMIEQSLNYNLVQAERLRQLGRLLRRNPPPWMPLLAGRLRAFDRLLVGVSTPMRELPVIGNNTSNPPAAWKGEEVRRRWFTRSPASTPRIDATGLGFASIAFPYSGYYAQRRDWQWDSPYLFMTNARPARGHHSMDNLAIELHAYGRPLLVRGGPPPYGLKFLAADRRDDAAAIEEYFNEHSSYKLNTVVVDGHSQTRTATPADAGHEDPVAGRWHATSSFDLMDGAYSLGYGPHDNVAAVDFAVSHQRRVIHVREFSCWVITDTMRSKDQDEHEFTQIWKFPPFRDANDGSNNPVCGFTPDQVAFGDGGIRTLDPAGPNLWLYQFANRPLAYTKRVGETDPYRGWYARFLGDLIPAVDMHSTWRARGTSIVATLCWPTPGGPPPPIKSFVAGNTERAQTSAAFTAALQSGATLAFAESVEGPRRLEAAGIRITGEMLVVTRQGRAARGLALGCTEWTDGRFRIRPEQPDFEFVCRADGGFDVVAPIGMPQGFRWNETTKGVAPDYDSPPVPPTAATRPRPAMAREVARLALPDVVPGEAGNSVSISGLSGVAWLGDDRYVAVPKTGDHLLAFRLPLDASGLPTAILELRALSIGGPEHRTDVTFDRPGQRLLVVDDAEPFVHAGRLDDISTWMPLGAPAVQATARKGKGLSAITTDPGTQGVWIANREALPADGLPAIGRLGTVVRLSEVLTQSNPANALQGMVSRREALYRVDPAHVGRSVTPGASSSGVAALAGVGDGRLLVLEASRAPAMPRFRNRLFVVSPADANGIDGMPEAERHGGAAPPVDKQLLWEQSGGVCLEGLCAGPTLPNGDHVLVAVGDNDSLGTPTTLVVLRWNPSDRPVPLLRLGWPVLAGLAVLGAGWGAFRLARAPRHRHCGTGPRQAVPARLVPM